MHPFLLDHRKDQGQVSLGQILISKISCKTGTPRSALSQDSKNVIYFDVRRLEMPGIMFRKVA